jgi:hypothetical protein
MIRYLKNGKNADDAASEDAQVRATVEVLLAASCLRRYRA